MLKSTYTRLPPKKIFHRNYKDFNGEVFLRDLSTEISRESLNGNYTKDC